MKNHQLSALNPQPIIKLSSFTCLAFIVNRVIDARPDRDLSFNELFDAAADGHLLTLVAERYGHIANFAWVTQSSTVRVEQMEAALRDAAAGFEGRVGKATSSFSGLCLVMDIVIEAIQQQCAVLNSKIENEKPQHFKGYQEFSRVFRN